ncbi:MAG: hypothetical protein U0575_08670 [Phycisphaerales bacterium]
MLGVGEIDLRETGERPSLVGLGECAAPARLAADIARHRLCSNQIHILGKRLVEPLKHGACHSG